MDGLNRRWHYSLSRSVVEQIRVADLRGRLRLIGIDHAVLWRLRLNRLIRIYGVIHSWRYPICHGLRIGSIRMGSLM